VKINKKNTNLLFPVGVNEKNRYCAVVHRGVLGFKFLVIFLQVTAVLRNLADVNGSRDLFLKTNILPELVSVLKIFKTDSDVVMNICRILRYRLI
jgi:hypothetical protein